MKKIILGSVIIVVTLGMSGCSSTLYDAISIKSNYSEATIAKARKVKFMSDKQAAKRCKYITEVSREGVAYSMGEAKTSAKRYLMLAAAESNGNTVAITDRLVTKNKMTKKIDLTASIYKCR